MDKNSMDSIFGVFNNGKTNDTLNSEQQGVPDMLWAFLILMLIGGWGTMPQDRTKEAYLQGKVDAYEKVIRRLF